MRVRVRVYERFRKQRKDTFNNVKIQDSALFLDLNPSKLVIFIDVNSSVQNVRFPSSRILYLPSKRSDDAQMDFI